MSKSGEQLPAVTLESVSSDILPIEPDSPDFSGIEDLETSNLSDFENRLDPLRDLVDEAIESGVIIKQELLAIAEELEFEGAESLLTDLQGKGVEVVDNIGGSDEYSNQTVSTNKTKNDAPIPDNLQLFLNSIGKHKLLKAYEEVQLAKRIERGDQEAKSRMVQSNLRLVVSIAKHYQGHGMTLAELIQEGTFGLNRAAEKFDWRRGYKFSTYATWWIRQSCQRAIANQGRTVRIPAHVHERLMKLNRATSRHLVTEGVEPSNDELHEITGLSPQHIEEALGAAEASISLDQPIADQDGSTLADLFPDRTLAPVEELAEESLRIRAVRNSLNSLPEREKRILELRFGFNGEPWTLEAIGQEMGMTRERARQLENQALRRLAALHEIQALDESNIET